MNFKRRNDRSGFTLIEVLIAITLLVFISFAMYRTVTQTFHLRAVLMEEGDFYNAIRLSMGLMERDLSSTLSPEMLVFPLPIPSVGPGGADIAQFDSAGSSLGSKFWGGLIAPGQTWQWRYTVFQGTDSSLSFVSESHRRMYKDSAESTFAKVNYLFREGTLIRNVSTQVFDLEKDDEPKPRQYLLLKPIESLKFRYFQKEKDQWVNAWDSTRAETRGVFPDLVELTFTIKTDPQQVARLNFTGTYLFRLEVPSRGIASSL